MNWKKLRRGDWRLTVSLATLGVVCPTVVWFNGGQSVRTVLARVETKQPLAADHEKLAAELCTCEQRLDAADTSLAQWERAAPRRRHTCRLWEQIDALACDAGMTIARFDAQSPIVHEQIEEIPVTIRGSGDLGQIAEFAQSVERLPTTVWIESIRIKKGDGKTKPATCELNLTILGRSQ
jgi:Tfp pilus assembly protein PilO